MKGDIIYIAALALIIGARALSAGRFRARGFLISRSKGLQYAKLQALHLVGHQHLRTVERC